MNLLVSEKASKWYKDEMLLDDGDYVRFFVRYGGHSSLQRGFSLGVSTENPDDLGVQTTQNGIHFYIEEKDLWYLDGHDLVVDFNESANEPEFKYQD